MILANEAAQTRAYQYYVTVRLSVLLLSSFENLSHHCSLVCLSECRHDDQPGEWTLLTFSLYIRNTVNAHALCTYSIVNRTQYAQEAKKC